MTKILYIDDDAQLRKLVQLLLTKAGFTVTTAGDGVEGVACYYADPVDVIITDIFMPNEEGLGTIRKLHHEQPCLPIIAVSGSSCRSPDWLKVAARLGAQRTLAKPFTMPQLIAVIAEVLPASLEPLGRATGGSPDCAPPSRAHPIFCREGAQA